MIEGEELEVVQAFRYLGSVDSADGYLTLEIKKVEYGLPTRLK